MGQQFGLGLRDLGKLRLQHLCNALMILLSRTLQQRLIGRVLNEGMLEAIRGLRRHPLLVEEFSLHQLVQPMLQRPLVHGETAWSSA